MTTNTRHEPPTAGELTADELGALAVQSGRLTADAVTNMKAALHNEALMASQLRSMLGSELLRMSGRELTLCTRTHRNSPAGCPVHGVRWSSGR